MQRAMGIDHFRLVQRMWGRFGRQTIIAALFLSTIACDFNSKPLGVVGHVPDGFGGAVSDEPLAAIIARDALSAGGNAADAAVALYFGLAATYPVAAGISGGGICVAHNAATGETGMVDFLLLPGPGRTADGRAALAAPVNIRGMAALHARFGRLRWEQLVLPGEQLARFGHRISRALARSIPPSADRLRRDPAARALFFRPDGSPLQEGDHLEQVALATILGQVRSRGAGALHSGPLARRYIEGAHVLDAHLSIEQLRGRTPVWRDPVRLAFGNHVVSLVPGSALAGLWRGLFVEKAYMTAPNGSKSAAVAETALARSARVPAAAGEADRISLDLDASGTTSFAVIDRAGGAAACGVSMNGAFGTGRMLPGIGVFAVAPPARREADRVSVAIITNANTGNGYFAGAASGGAISASVLAGVAGRALFDEQPLKAAVDAERIAADPEAGIVYTEPGVAEGGLAALRSRAAVIVRRERLGRVTAIHCPEGIKDRYETCDFQADPRGFGHAVSAEQ